MHKLLTALLFLIPSAYAAAPPTAAPNPGDAVRISAQQAMQQQFESLERQRRSVRQQLGEPVNAVGIPVSNFFDPWPAQAPCPAMDPEELRHLITATAQEQALPPELIHAVIKRESAFKPCAVSERGAQGLMQLMPGTSRQFGVADPFDPSQNIKAGAAFLHQLLTRYKGDLELALAAYNAGPGRADQQNSREFPLETQNYLRSILADLATNPSDLADIRRQINPKINKTLF